MGETGGRCWGLEHPTCPAAEKSPGRVPVMLWAALRPGQGPTLQKSPQSSPLTTNSSTLAGDLARCYPESSYLIKKAKT